MPVVLGAPFLALLVFLLSTTAASAAAEDSKPSVSSSELRLPGVRRKDTHKMAPWQTPMQCAHGVNHPIIQAKCGDDLFFWWNAEKHGLFLIPTATCPELFIDASAAGIMELMPVTTEGNVTIELDEPGHFWFADPLYCRSHNMSVQVDVHCHNEPPRFSDYGLRSWYEAGDSTSASSGDSSNISNSNAGASSLMRNALNKSSSPVAHDPPPYPPMLPAVRKSLSAAVPHTGQAPQWDPEAPQRFPEQVPALDAFMY